jgi:ribosomal subunit interface protein
VDLVVKARGLDLTQRIRKVAEQKLAKIGRLDPRVLRLEVEIIGEHNPRVQGRHRVEVTCLRPRRTFRARGTGDDVDGALDQVVERLERQITSYRERLRTRRHAEG